MFRFLAVLISFAIVALEAQDKPERFAGFDACARCHATIANSQGKTAMANSWRGSSGSFLPSHFNEQISEGNGRASYQVRRVGDGVEFSVESSGKDRVTAPVEAMVGGNRHGISFLLRLDELGGIPIARPALIEARYALFHLGSLVLSPGFLKEPGDHEDELGRVLSPAFEERCLTCHGKPETAGAGKLGGIRCESCHGPASDHVESLSAMKASSEGSGKAPKPIFPEHLAGARIMEACVQCHQGISTVTHSDPMPEDVLVSSQVPALRNSQCFIQSGERITCTACHNPHDDATPVEQASVKVCLQCHSTSVRQHAAICPVNRTQGCVGCHMPTVQSNAFHLTDHWIRVQPSLKQKTAVTITAGDDSLRTQVLPLRMFLRMIVVDGDAKAKAAVTRLVKGEAFSVVAHDLSEDPTAPGGGFVGDMKLADMNPKLATEAAKLAFGAYSEVIAVDAARIILYRMPRDFKWEADRLYLEAVDLNGRGDRAGAATKVQQALDIYPYLLRGLVLLGTTLAEAGDVTRATQILQFASETYPKDARTQFDYALTLGKQPARQIEVLRRAIEIDGDMVPAYQSLGAALYSTGQAAAAIDAFRQGLRADPLSALLYYDLGLALKEQGDRAGSERALVLAARLDPEIAARQAASK